MALVLWVLKFSMEQRFHNSSLGNFRVWFYFEMYVSNCGFILSRCLRMMIYDFQNLSSLNLGLIQFLGQQSVGDFRIFSWFSKSTWREQVWCIQKVERWCLSNFSTLKYYVSLLNWVLAHQKFRNLGIFVMYFEEKHCHMALMILVGVLKCEGYA